MCQLPRVLLPLCLAALTACAEQTEPAAAEAQGKSAGKEVVALATAPAQDSQAIGTIGPVEYAFSPERLTRAEILLDLPPDFDTVVLATKLIPAGRAAMLGEERCRYGAQARPQLCTAEAEDGLSLALLDRPIADYRRKFAQAGVAESALERSTLSGVSGFAFTANREGAVTAYGFYPAGERALLVARRSSRRPEPDDRAIDQVLASLHFPAPD